MNSGHFEMDLDFDDISGAREWMEHPEQRLLWAVIERAVRDVLGNNVSERMQAEEWLYANDSDLPEEFSFQWICEMLDLSPREIWRKIQNVKAHPEISTAVVMAQAA